MPVIGRGRGRGVRNGDHHQNGQDSQLGQKNGFQNGLNGLSSTLTLPEEGQDSPLGHKNYNGFQKNGLNGFSSTLTASEEGQFDDIIIGRRGIRGVRRPISFLEEKLDMIQTKPSSYPGDSGKKGFTGDKVTLSANYFTLTKRPDWCIYNYHVDIKPVEQERTFLKKSLVRQHSDTLGPYIYDGTTLYTATRLQQQPLRLTSVRPFDQQKYELTIHFVKELTPEDVTSIQFYNLILRKCMGAMGLEQVNRNFFDKGAEFNIPGLGLTIWPGYKTSMRNFEKDVLLCVEPIHKILRKDTVLDFMKTLGNPQSLQVQNKMKEKLVGQIVVTNYNGKTYKIHDIDFSNTPQTRFETQKNGVKKSLTYIDYYEDHYPGKAVITDKGQPLLVSKMTTRETHRGMTGNVHLIPELCQMTGLSEEMRTNQSQMRQFDTEMNMTPEQRVTKIRDFMYKLKLTPEAKMELNRWSLDFSRDIVNLTGRVIPQETILFNGGIFEPKDEPRRLKADWSAAFRNKKFVNAPELRDWVIIVCQWDVANVEKLITTMQGVASKMNFSISRPTEIMTMPDIRIPTFDLTMQRAMSKHKNLQMIFFILSNENPEVYGNIKRKCTVQYGIPSQCFQSRKLKNLKGLMSITTKCVVQMCAKLGGEPWAVNNIKDLMVLGFDVHHSPQGQSWGALVSTTSQNFAQYYSTVSHHENREEISPNICRDVTKCLTAYKNRNGVLPTRIIMYRDGVGDGQLSFVYDIELQQVKEAVRLMYEGLDRQPKLTYIIVTKRIDTRIFADNTLIKTNPVPGTCVDDVITKPESYDFYLVSQTCKEGTTVSPIRYNVIFDEQEVKPDSLQKLTFKLCHMYFNWSGCVSVPAPVQYAHSLAFQTGTTLGHPPNELLADRLHFL